MFPRIFKIQSTSWGSKALQKSTAKALYTRRFIDNRHTHRLIMLPFRSVSGWFCVPWDFFVFGTPNTYIDLLRTSRIHAKPLTLTSKFDIDLDLWPWPLPSTLWPQNNLKDWKCDVKTRFIAAWPWTLTYDLDLQSQPSQGLGRPSCQKSRS